MRKSNFEDQILDWMEGTLSDSERRSFEQAMEDNAELKRTVEEYQRLINLESHLRSEEGEPSLGFSIKVMEAIDGRGLPFFERWCMRLGINGKGLASLAATAAVVALCVIVKNELNEQDPSLVSPEVVTQIVPDKDKLPQDDKRPNSNAGAHDASEGAVLVAPLEPAKNLSGVPKDSQAVAKLEDKRVRKESPLNAQAPSQLREGREDLSAKTVEPVSPQAVAPGLEKLQNSKPVTRPVIGGEVDSELQRRSKKTEFGNLSQAAGMPAPLESEDAVSRRQNWAPSVPSSNGAQYLGYIENPRVVVRDQPVSTFSIDVDTGSYTNVRRLLRSGSLPPTDSVRIEEFLNYFSYAYPSEESRPFSVSYEVAPSPFNEGKHLIKVGIKAREIPKNIKGWNLVFLVDVSGSMMPENKLPLIQKALPLLVEQMSAEDRISIVTYAGAAGTVLDGSRKDDKNQILNAIQNLNAGGSTNGSGGINAAYDVAKRNFIDGGVNRVILTTDGDFNVGVTSVEDLKRLIEEKRKLGITLTTIGVGGDNIHDGTMEQLADNGNGNYFYFDSFDEARKVFQDNLAGNMEVIAKDVKLQIEFNPQSVVEYRLVGYDNRKLKNEDFNNDSIDAGDIGSGHTVTAMYEVTLASSPKAKEIGTTLRYQAEQPKAEATPNSAHNGELAFLQIRFKKPEGSTSELLQYPLSETQVKNTIGEASSDFRFAVAVAGAGSLLRRSNFSGEISWEKVLELAQGAYGEDKEGTRREFVNLMKTAKSLSSGQNVPSYPVDTD